MSPATKQPKNDVDLFKSKRKRLQTPRPKMIPVKQDPKVDWTKIPIDDNHVICQITGGEALKVCEEALQERKDALDLRMKRIRKLKRLARFSKELRDEIGVTYFAIRDIYSTHITAEISFSKSKRPRRGRRDTKAENHQRLSKALEKDGRFRVKPTGFMLGAGRGEYYCELAINRKKNAPEVAKEIARMARKILEPLPGSHDIASRILNPPEPGRGDKLPGGERFVAHGNGLAILSAGVFQRGSHWFLAYPADPDKPPAKFAFPCGILKRLKMSQYWRLVEAVALDG